MQIFLVKSVYLWLAEKLKIKDEVNDLGGNRMIERSGATMNEALFFMYGAHKGVEQ